MKAIVGRMKSYEMSSWQDKNILFLEVTLFLEQCSMDHGTFSLGVIHLFLLQPVQSCKFSLNILQAVAFAEAVL